MRNRTESTWRTLDGPRTDSGVVFVVGSNLPGYLPESDPYAFDDVDSALDSLVSDVDSHADILAEYEGADVDSDLAHIRSAIASGDARFQLQRSGAVEFLVGADHGFGGRVFFVHARAIDVVGPADD